MKTLEEQIKVMQHFANGGEIENTDLDYKEDGKDYIWDDCYKPVWDWSSYDYRIKEKKQTVTIETWLVQDLKDGEYYEIVTSDIASRERSSNIIRVKLLGSDTIYLDSTEK